VRLFSSFGTKGLFIEIVSPLYAVETAVPKSVINLDKDFYIVLIKQQRGRIKGEIFFPFIMFLFFFFFGFFFIEQV